MASQVRSSRALAELRACTTRIEDGGERVLEQVMHALSAAFQAETSMAFGWQRTIDGVGVDFVHSDTCDAKRLRELMGRLLDEQGVAWGAYDPLYPAAEDRNRAVALREHLGGAALRRLVVHRGMVTPLGLGDHDQLRVLVCDGPRLLAWVGAYRARPFSRREVSALQEIVPMLSRRLVLERRLAERSWTSAAMGALLDELGAPGFVVTRDGTIVHASASGERMLARSFASACAEIREALRGDERRMRVMTLAGRGIPDHLLVLSKGGTPASPPLPAALESIAELLAMGLTDKEIAQRTGRSLRTVRTYVARLYQRTGLHSRAAVASWWHRRRLSDVSIC